MAERSDGFRFLEHVTDAEIEAFGKNLEEAFENAARAIEETMVDLKSIAKDETKEILVRGKDEETLLYSWIESLISLQETDGLIFSKFLCRISKDDSGFVLRATAIGEKFNPKKHEQKTAIKAPTFHDMNIKQRGDGVVMHFLVDL
ncbi:MAG: archease [Thaumarchaeota archaeon]|nr:archease [Nitrososphaerota archaeon]